MNVPEHDICYLEIVTPDAQGARDFYSQAHGWPFEDLAPELGNAFVAVLPNGSHFGIRAPMHEQEKPTVRSYIRVADLESSMEKAEESGATVILGSMEIPGRGRIAIYEYGGIEQGIWQLP